MDTKPVRGMTDDDIYSAIFDNRILQDDNGMIKLTFRQYQDHLNNLYQAIHDKQTSTKIRLPGKKETQLVTCNEKYVENLKVMGENNMLDQCTALLKEQGFEIEGER